MEEGMSDWEVIPGAPEPIEFTATLRQNNDKGIKLFCDDPKKKEDSDGNEEYLLEVGTTFPIGRLPWLSKVKEEHVQFLVILDRSGSMSGQPWAQVQSAMLKILELTRGNSKIDTKIMTYNHTAEILKEQNQEKERAFIKNIRAQGSTNFVAVFDKIGNFLESQTSDGILTRMMKKSSGNNEKRKVFVIFMTDGQDTCNNAAEILRSKEALQVKMEKYGEEVIVHVLGFSASHDEEFLENLSLMGTSDGSYSFIAPSDGSDALEKRLTDLLEATTGLVGKSVFLDLKLAGDSRFLGDWFGSEESDTVLQGFLKLNDDGTAEVKTWKFMKLPKGQDLKLTISLLKDLKDGTTIVPGKLGRVTVLHFDAEEYEGKKLSFRKLRTALNLLTAKIGVSEDDPDKVSRELKPWYEMMKVKAKDVPERSTVVNDEEMDQFIMAVKNGMSLCDNFFAMEGNSSLDAGYKRKKQRALTTDYEVSSKQFHNVMACKSVPAARSEGKGTRNAFKSRQKKMD